MEMEEEQVIIIPDLFVPKEELHLYDQGFSQFFTRFGYGRTKAAVDHMIRMVPRADAEKLPNPHGERIRQLVANVLVFIIPDELYLSAQTYKKNAIHDAYVLQQIKEHAVLMACQKLKGSGEARLHGKLSVAFGGHVEPGDVLDGDMTHVLGSSRPAFDYMMHHAAVREVAKEELVGDAFFEDYVDDHVVPMGIINSSFSEVESLHFGCISVLAVPEFRQPKIHETEKLAEVWIPLEDFKRVDKLEQYYELEQWTRLTLAHNISTFAHFIAKSAAGQQPFK